MTTLRKYLPNLSGSLLIYWGVLLAALFLFGQSAGEVYEKEGFFFDAPILGWLAAHQTPWLIGIAQAFSTFGSPLVLGSVAAAAVLILWLRLREFRAALFLTLGLGGAMLLNVLFKLFLLGFGLPFLTTSPRHRATRFLVDTRWEVQPSFWLFSWSFFTCFRAGTP